METCIALLVGDQHIRRVIGQLDAPKGADITARADRAMMQFKRI